MDLASAEAEIRHVFGDTPITEASIGAAPPDILVKLSGYWASFSVPLRARSTIFANFCLVFCGGKSFGMVFFHFKTARQE